jgi:hypothetical protein
VKDNFVETFPFSFDLELIKLKATALEAMLTK